MRRVGGGVVIGAVVLVALALTAAVILLFLAPRNPLAGVLVPEEEPAPRWAPPVDPPAAAETPGTGVAGLVDPVWLAETAEATGIPTRALAAYAGAALWKAATMPECALSWNTIAAIGAVESDHGRHDGSTVGEDGTVAPPIYGVTLSGGEGVEHIPDSDAGTIDGDADYDRAVGPFQLIPQTWRNWHTDGNGDGVEDPQNIDDAAMATANYLCRAASGAGVWLDTEAGWRIAIASFNSPPVYLDSVATYAVDYAHATSGPATPRAVAGGGYSEGRAVLDRTTRSNGSGVSKLSGSGWAGSSSAISMSTAIRPCRSGYCATVVSPKNSAS